MRLMARWCAAFSEIGRSSPDIAARRDPAEPMVVRRGLLGRYPFNEWFGEVWPLQWLQALLSTHRLIMKHAVRRLISVSVIQAKLG